MPLLGMPLIMREEILTDITGFEGVKWVVIIGPDALSIEHSPREIDIEKYVANWHALESKSPENTKKIHVKAENALLFSEKIDDAHMLLVGADMSSNVGAIRSKISDEVGKLMHFI